MKKIDERINNFINSRDYRDICYFINHVGNIEFRRSLLKELGYHMGVEFPREKIPLGGVFLGKKKDLRMYISNKFQTINLAYSIILDGY